MKKQSLTTKLHKPMYPMLGKVGLCIGILFAAGALAYLLHRESMVSPTTNKLPPTKAVSTLPTSVPTQQVAMFTPMPTPTLVPGQKAIYTFYIQTTSHKSSQELVLTPSDTGRIFTANIRTLIILYFGTGNFQISHSSPQDIFEAAGSKSNPIHLPSNSIGAFNIVRSGYGTITVTETE